jgi:predicted SAM-dependent methyltransferase
MLGTKIFKLKLILLLLATALIVVISYKSSQRYLKKQIYELESTLVHEVRALAVAENRFGDERNNYYSTYSEGFGYNKKQYEYISRQDFINLIDPNKDVLEIGPFVKPSIIGAGVKYFDVNTKEELIVRAKADKDINLTDADLEKRTPMIDFVDPHGDLKSIKNQQFDIVYSSHNIEHTLDLIQNLQDVSSLLKAGGKYYMFVPDKRFCFDHFVPETRMSEVIAVHEEGKNIHSLQTILTMRCETTHNNSIRHWHNDHGRLTASGNLECYKAAVKEFKEANGHYIDSHKWRFTPESFELIIMQLQEMKYIDLKIEKLYGTMMNSHEFEVILYKP